MRERYLTDPDPDEPMRLAIGRVRLRSVARVGFSIGWIVSLIPALLVSGLAAWILRGIWSTLDGWTPWTPWSPNTRIAGFALPTPEFRPREALHVNGLYELLAPIGHHPILGAALGTVALTVVGGLLFALILLLAGGAYNLFARFTGGLEFEMVPRRQLRPAPRDELSRPASRRATKRPRDRERPLEDDTSLRW